jgi:peptidoglycan/LPS O-acetylase OafA/YrhL
LDGFRGIAILMVITVHFWAHSAPGGVGFPVAILAGDHRFALEWVFLSGSLGVTIFFALSGFLLWYPFAKALAEGSPIPSPTRFYVRRLRRIMPAFLCFACAYLLLVYTVGPNAAALPISSDSIAANLFFMAPVVCLFSGNAVPDLVPGTWSLTPEMWFYLLLPMIALLSTAIHRKLHWLLIVAMLALGTWYRHYVVGDPRPIAHLNLRACIHVFAWGMAAANLVIACPRIVSRPIFAYLGAALIVFGAWWRGALFGYLDTYFLVGLGAALIIMSVTGAESKIRALCDAPLLRFIGKISFSLFLCNLIVVWYVFGPLWKAFHIAPGPARFAVLVVLGFPVAIGLATLGYEWIERPWLERTTGPQPFRLWRRGLAVAGGIRATPLFLRVAGRRKN